MNRGDHFEPKALPDIASLSPCTGVCVADFDGDGREDIFLSQNFFGVELMMDRADAGRGLILRGLGTGEFEGVEHSGIEVYGEGRGAAVSDFDGDGRVDLAVSQNGAATKLYHNESATPGLRVRLGGLPGNSLAIGASLRARYGTRWGPLREVQAGQGWWSQNSVTMIFAGATRVDEIEIRWPGKPAKRFTIPANSQSIVIDPTEGLRVSAPPRN